jgi:membrane associated rhomboid family serine protease
VFPIRDENPTLRKPIATLVVIGLNVAAWALLQGLGSTLPLLRSVCELGLIPAELLGNAPPGTQVALGDATCVLDGSNVWITPLTSMFMHGGWLHIVGNLWFLWVFGDNVEDSMGPGRFALFYLLCGLAAACAQVASDPSSTIPMVGASGAIGGVMGAYARLYPRAHVQLLVVLGFYVTTTWVPALLMLGYWFALQILGGLPTLAGGGPGVAFWAHAGGFVTGVVLVGAFRRPDYVAQHRRRHGAVRPGGW